MVTKIVKNSVLGLGLIVCGSTTAMELQRPEIEFNVLAALAMQELDHLKNPMIVQDEEIVINHAAKEVAQTARKARSRVKKRKPSVLTKILICKYCTHKCFHKQVIIKHLQKEHCKTEPWASHYSVRRQ